MTGVEIRIYVNKNEIFGKKFSRRAYIDADYTDEELIEKLRKFVSNETADEMCYEVFEMTESAIDDDGYEWCERKINGNAFLIETFADFEPEETEDMFVFEREDKSDDF